MEKRYYLIYKTTNLLNGNYYIGMHSTVNLNDGYIGSGIKLRHSVKKYGRDNHQTEILEFVESEAMMRLRESEIVNDELLKDPLCMNLQRGGEGKPKGTPCSEETRKKISEAIKGKPRQKMSDETKAKIALVHIGKRKQSLHKPLIVDGVEYPTLADAAIATGIARSTLWNRAQSDNHKFKDTYFKDESN